MKPTLPKILVGKLCLRTSFFVLLFFTAFHPASAQTMFYDNCEQLPQTGWGMDYTRGYAMVTGGNQNVNNPAPTANITLSNAYARKGNTSYRMHLEKRTDYPGCCEWVRSEVMWMSPNQQTMQNEWRFAAVSILIDPSFQFENRPTQIGFDSKASPDDLQTPFWLGIMNGQYYIDGYFIGGTTYLGPVIKGVWEDWLLERNWSAGSDGFLRFYRNGKLVYEKYGANYFNRPGDAPISRIQHGLYKWVWATSGGQGWGEGSPVSAANAPMDIYLDEIRFGSPSAQLSDFLLDAAAPPPPANLSPTVQAGNNLTITLPANSVTVSGNASDPDGSIADYSWTKVSGPNAGVIGNEDDVSTMITGLAAGTYVFRLTVTDNNGATAFDNIQVTVNAANLPNQLPTVQAGANQTITLPLNSVTLSGVADDEDGSVSDYTWSKVSGPAGGTIQSPDDIRTVISGLLSGVYVFRLTVTDDDGGTAYDNVQVTVNAAPPPPPNILPAASAGPNKVITLPVNSVTATGSGTDSDGSIADYTWTKVSGPNSGNITTADAASTTITGLTAGTYVFRLTVTDNRGGVDTDDMVVVVNPAPAPPANEPPSAAAGANIVIRLPKNAVTLNGSGADADGQVASYRWTKVSGPNSGTLQSPNAQSTGMSGLTTGVYVIRLTVTDNEGATETDEVQVTVLAALPAPANESPTANAGADLRIVLPVNVATLNGVGTDVDGTIASYSWSKVSGPATGNIANAAAQSTGVTGLTAGVHVFRLTIKDNDGAESTDEMRVVVVAAAPLPNQAPVASAGNDRVITLPVNSVNVRGSGVDGDGTIETYLWQKISGPASGAIQDATNAATSFTGLTAGEYVFRLTVRDDDGATASDELKITVNPAAPLPNQMPLADAGPDIEIMLPANTAVLNGSNSSDPDGTIATYSWALVQGPVSGTITNGNTPQASLSNLVEGVYEFELTITDNDGASSADQVLVTVSKNNQRPVIVITDTVSVYLPAQNTQLDASQSYDSDGNIQTFLWEKVSGPGNPAILNPGSGKAIVTGLIKGTYTYSVTVTDNSGTSVKKIVTVLVLNSTARRLIPVINLYPNPAETNVTITVDSEVDGKSDVVFYDILGRPVLRDTFQKNSRTYQRKINISNLSDGVYAVEISIDQAEKVVRKVVKQ